MSEIITFLILSLFVVLVPGVDFALITRRTIAHGKLDGLKMVLGLTTGALLHTLTAAVGLSMILMQSALAFEIIRYLGALYLIYLGLSSFIKKKKSTNKDLTNQTEATNKVRNGSAYKQGLISNILNPKVALFFLTFLPQFVIPGYHASLQFIIMGTIYALFTISWYTTLVYLLAYVRKWLLSPKVQGTIDKITGLALLGFGLNILLNNPSESK